MFNNRWQVQDAKAVAIVHQMTVVTRNARDFRPFGVRTLDPFADRAPNT